MKNFNHILRVLASTFSETLWPTRCIGCDLPGTLLCPTCSAKLPYIDLSTACPRCGAPYGSVVCTECTAPYGQEEQKPRPAGEGRLYADEFPFAAARAACSYEGLAKRMLTAYKDADELRLDRIIASCLCKAVRGSGEETGGESGEAVAVAATGKAHGSGGGGCCGSMEPALASCPGACGSSRTSSSCRTCTSETGRQAPSLTNPAAPHSTDWSLWADALVCVPASPANLKRRGYDHMQRIGALCGEWLGVPVSTALRSGTASDQRGLDSRQRMDNRMGSYEIAGSSAIPGRILLVDDVFTTGATVCAASQVLLDAGAREVRVATFARVW